MGLLPVLLRFLWFSLYKVGKRVALGGFVGSVFVEFGRLLHLVLLVFLVGGVWSATGVGHMLDAELVQ